MQCVIALGRRHVTTSFFCQGLAFLLDLSDWLFPEDLGLLLFKNQPKNIIPWYTVDFFIFRSNALDELFAPLKSVEFLLLISTVNISLLFLYC